MTRQPLLLLAAVVSVPAVAAAQPVKHNAGCEHRSSACPYAVFTVKRHRARKAEDLPVMMAAVRYGVSLLRKSSKAIRDKSHIMAVYNALLWMHEARPKTSDDERAIAEAREVLGKHYGWREVAGAWWSPDDVRDAMGWEQHGDTWWPKKAWKLHRDIQREDRLVKRRISEIGGDASALETAQAKLDRLTERKRKLGSTKREAQANIQKAKKKLPELRKEKEKLKKAYDKDTTDEEAKKAWQLALIRVRGALDDIEIEELRLKDVKNEEKKLPGRIKAAKKELKKARRKLGPGLAKVAPGLKKLETMRKKLAEAWAEAEAEWKNDRLLERRLKARKKKK